MLPFSTKEPSTHINTAKKFSYTTPPLKASPSNLIATPLLGSKAFHMLATPEEIEAYVPELLKLRTQRGITASPYISWEPLPAACTPQNKHAFLRAYSLVNVFSPNHIEIASIFNSNCGKAFNASALEAHSQYFSNHVGTHGTGIVIIRAGEHGSLTTCNDNTTRHVWLPAYYPPGDGKVVDPTGAGNAFLGGFMQGWIASRDILEGSVYGSVAASFALEQIGLPRCEESGGGEERWNGVRVWDRIGEYKDKLRGMGLCE